MAHTCSSITRIFNPSQAAHLCIDMQVGYCDQNHPATQERQETVKDAAQLSLKIHEFSKQARHINLINIWVVHALPKILCEPKNINWEMSQRGKKKWAKHSLHGVVAKHNEPIIPKETTDAFKSTSLTTILKNQRKKSIVISGLYANECVKDSAISGRKHGFNVFLLKDLIGFPKSLRCFSENYFKHLQTEYGIIPIYSKDMLSLLHPENTSSAAHEAQP